MQRYAKAGAAGRRENEVFRFNTQPAASFSYEKTAHASVAGRKEDDVLFARLAGVPIPILQDARKILQRPIDQFFNMGHQTFSAPGETVFYPRGYLWKNFPNDQSVSLQITKGNSKHPLGDIPQTAMDLPETERPVGFECNQHQERPLVPQTSQKIPDGTNSGMMKIFHTHPPFLKILLVQIFPFCK